MEKKKIIKIYKDKLELLNKYNKSYFDKNKSLVSDQVFDELKHEVLNLENQYNFLKSDDSPSKKVGFKPSKNSNIEFLCSHFQMRSQKMI